MILGQGGAPHRTNGDVRGEVEADRRSVGSARAQERARLRARLRSVLVPGLEALVDPASDPADLIAAAGRQATLLRTELEPPLPAATGPADELRFRTLVRDAREEEREWFRGHLHDTVLQILEFIAGDGFGTGLSAKQIARLAGGAARDMRRWIDSESATDLVAALEVVTDEARAMDANVELEIVGILDRAPTGERVNALTGAVREALTNARKHANASRIVVRVEPTADGTAITVTDDGVGIDPERIAAARGLGVRGSILGRMARVGGHASLNPAPGGGTRVTLLTPPERRAGGRT